jgi:hypothetical protein|tara:strand:- start:4308 stop:4526 length:219 start_codon:yes stop_codon:yes gene_type:complete
MKVNVLEEITDWEFPNNTYVTVRGNQKIIGYYKLGKDPLIEFKKPINFSTSRRKFITDKTREKEWNRPTDLE